MAIIPIVSIWAAAFCCSSDLNIWEWVIIPATYGKCLILILQIRLVIDTDTRGTLLFLLFPISVPALAKLDQSSAELTRTWQLPFNHPRWEREQNLLFRRGHRDSNTFSLPRYVPHSLLWLNLYLWWVSARLPLLRTQILCCHNLASDSLPN